MPESIEELMRLALEEAQKSTRKVKPNPKVGAAILTKKGEVVVAKHEEAGKNHAEINAIEEAKKRGYCLDDATIAVTLEPCCHEGRTPPCVKALIKSGFSKVIVGSIDSSSKVNGEGIRQLSDRGIECVSGVLEHECIELNREWLFAHSNMRPFVTVKMATSLDGRWYSDNGESQWITGEEARNEAHKLRARVDSIVTSYDTVKKDDPKMTARPDGMPIEDQPGLYLFSRKEAQTLDGFRVKKRGAKHLDGQQGIEPAMRRLFENDDQHDVMVEAGPRLSAAFLSEGCFEELWLFMGMRFLGGRGGFDGLLDRALPGVEVELTEFRLVGEDILLIARRRH